MIRSDSFRNVARALAFVLLAGSLACCSSSPAPEPASSDDPYARRGKDDLYKNGSVLSDQGGWNLFGGDDKRNQAEGLGMAVNGYLWRATLDTIAFMPIATVDPFGGVITTDWYSTPIAPNERIKLNVFILDRDLRADGVRVSVFRQIRTSASGPWTDADVASATASSLENTILTRARQLRLAGRDKP